MHETSRYRNKKGLTNSNYQKLKTLKNKIMKELELKHLAGYLPYGLKGHYLLSDVVPTTKDELRDKLLTLDNVKFFLDYAKPILRPLSDLTKYIEVNGEKFVPIEKLGFPNTKEVYGSFLRVIPSQHVPYCEMQKLFEWHFDIHGLIENNLAIDINTL